MYGIEKRIIRPASLRLEQLITQSEAFRLLGVSQQALLIRVNDGLFTVVWRCRGVGGMGSARLLLRSEVERYAAGDRRRGGITRRVAPELCEGAPELDGAEFGIEERVVMSAPWIGAEDVIGQKAAREVLGVHKSVLVRQMNRGRFTVVWDLGRDGFGYGSARLLLRCEVVEAAAGGRRMRRGPYRVLAR